MESIDRNNAAPKEHEPSDDGGYPPHFLADVYAFARDLEVDSIGIEDFIGKFLEAQAAKGSQLPYDSRLVLDAVDRLIFTANLSVDRGGQIILHREAFKRDAEALAV